MPIPSRRRPLVRLSTHLLPLMLLIGLPGWAQDARPARISYFEVFNPTSVSSGRASIAAASSSGKRRLDMAAFGQTHRLELEPNTRLTGNSSPLANAQHVLSGSVDGKADSWVRLFLSDTQAEGLIWDGQDLYAVEPASAIADMVTPPLRAPTGGSVIFRLADTQILLGANFCGAPGPEALGLSDNGLAEYQALAAELASATPTQGIEISALGDTAFRNQYSSNVAAQDAMWVRLNNLDGIYSAQIGTRMLASSLKAYDTDPAALSSDTNAKVLLDSLATLRFNDSGLRSSGLTHLFTGRDIATDGNSNTVGIAYVGTLCSSRYAAGLTESRTRGAWIDSLIAAHEIGHSLGAIHDGEDACASTPLTYIMAPQINGSSTFSQCSLDKIFPTLQSASCLVTVDTPDPSIAADLGTTKALSGAPFTWALAVTNKGTADATGLTVQISFQPALTIAEGSVAGGSCIASAGTATCTFDSLVPGETRMLNFSLRADTVGAVAVTATASTNADSNPTNNSGSGEILIEQPSAAATATTEEHGGGGTFGWNLLGLLFGLGLVRSRAGSGRRYGI